MIEILNHLTRLNRNLRLDDDLEGFTVSPSLQNEHVDLLALVSANKDRILELLIDSHKLVTAIENWAKGNPTKWREAWSRFHKNYRPYPYAWDAYDHLMSWLGACKRLHAARQTLQKLQGRKHKSNADIVSIDARVLDIKVYKQIAVRQRERLVAALLYHADLYGQIIKYTNRRRNNGSKEKAVANK